jgi:hypothetical protein
MTRLVPQTIVAVSMVMATSGAFSTTVLADTAADKAAAEALFLKGRDLLEQGQMAEACKNFEASQRLDAGLGTLLYLADCYERAGRTASAWATFREAASLAKGRGDDARADVASERAKVLEAKLSKVWIKVADGNPPDLVVERDGNEVPRATWGLAIPVDMGTHQLRAHAPGKQDWTGSVAIENDGQTASIEIPVLAEAPMPEARAPAPVPPDGSSTIENRGDEGSGQKTAGFVIGGVGVIGVVVGSIFGLQAISKNDDSVALCDPDDESRCTAEGKSLRDDAQTAALISTIAFGVGGAALATGIVLVVTAPSGSDSDSARLELRTRMRSGGAGLELGGSW